MFIRYRNGSTWQIIGSDRYDATVGAGVAGITFSEYALSNPSAWGYYRPMVEENNGWAIFITTPRGRNHAHSLYDYARKQGTWFCELLTARETGALTPQQLDEALAEYQALYGEDVGRAQFRQEYLCIPSGEMVVCHDRAKAIEDIRPGDAVLTHTGRFRRVERVMQREYVGPMVRIEVYGSPDIVCTPEHPVYVCNPLQQTYLWKEAKEVAVGDWLVTPRMDMRQEPLIPPSLAIIIGWYVSDGHVAGNAVIFSIGSHKPDCIRELCEALALHGREAKVTALGSVTSIQVNDVALADFLVGECGSLAHNKRLPLGLLRGNEQVVWDTLFKGDGHIRRREGEVERYCYVSVSKGLVHQVIVVGAALGFGGTISVRAARRDVIEGRVVNCRESYWTNLGRNVAQRKEAKIRSAKNGMLGRVHAVSTEDYAGLVHNMEVAGDHSYTVNGRAVHNCDWQAAILGAFYAFEMADVRKEQRIVEIEATPGQPVHRAWDLGVGDDTSIWFFQPVGGQLFILDHYSASGVGLEHYRDIIEQKHATHGWRHGEDHVPHDAKVKELGTGRTRVETMRSLGLNPHLVPNATLDDGINAVRRTLPLCVFHPRTEPTGIEALEQYRREWNEEAKTYRKSAVHDWCFTGETELLTRYGTYRMMDLPQQGEVMTPCGWKPYHSPRMTRKNARLVEVRFADGLTVKCTPDHMFMTANGWKSAANLIPGMPIQSCWTLSRNISIQVRNTIRAVAKNFTGMFGKGPLVLFLPNATSITAIAIEPIMPFPISNAFRLTNTDHCHRKTDSKEPNAKEMANYFEPNGIAPIIADTQSANAVGPSGSASRANAINAKLSSMLWCVKAAIARSFAAIAARSPHIESVVALNERQDVYCLTVPDAAAFALKNGAIVHNCSHPADAFRYLSLAWRAVPQASRLRPTPGYRPRVPLASVFGNWRIPPPDEPRTGRII